MFTKTILLTNQRDLARCKKKKEINVPKRIKKVTKIEKLDFKRFKKKIVILIKIFILISE